MHSVFYFLYNGLFSIINVDVLYTAIYAPLVQSDKSERGIENSCRIDDLIPIPIWAFYLSQSWICLTCIRCTQVTECKHSFALLVVKFKLLTVLDSSNVYSFKSLIHTFAWMILGNTARRRIKSNTPHYKSCISPLLLRRVFRL